MQKVCVQIKRVLGYGRRKGDEAVEESRHEWLKLTSGQLSPETSSTLASDSECSLSTSYLTSGDPDRGERRLSYRHRLCLILPERFRRTVGWIRSREAGPDQQTLSSRAPAMHLLLPEEHRHHYQQQVVRAAKYNRVSKRYGRVFLRVADSTFINAGDRFVPGARHACVDGIPAATLPTTPSSFYPTRLSTIPEHSTPLPHTPLSPLHVHSTPLDNDQLRLTHMYSLAPILTELILTELRSQGQRVMLADIEVLIEPFLGERMIQEVVSVMLEKGLSENFCVRIVMEAWEMVNRHSSAERSRQGDSGIEMSEDEETGGWEDDWDSGFEV